MRYWSILALPCAVLRYSHLHPPPPPFLLPPPTGTDKIKRASNFGFKRSRRYFISKQEEAWRPFCGMCWCKKELPVCWMAVESWAVYHQQMYAEETEMSCYGLRHYRRWVAYKASIATQNKSYINITTIYVKSVGWFTQICIPLLISSKNALPHSRIGCNVS